MLDVRTESFEGPLDLLLQLIEQEELDITEVSLAKVTDQYLKRLSELSFARHVDELADFLVIAAKLLLIKSKTLLPHLSQEEEEEIDDLKARLKMYQEFVQAAKKIEKLYAVHRVAFPRPASVNAQMVQFAPPKQCSVQTFAGVYRALIETLEITLRLPKKIVFDTRVSIHERMHHIRTLITQCREIQFAHTLSHASVSDVVVSFMALLELIKQRVVYAEQTELFSDIRIVAHT